MSHHDIITPLAFARKLAAITPKLPKMLVGKWPLESRHTKTVGVQLTLVAFIDGLQQEYE